MSVAAKVRARAEHLYERAAELERTGRVREATKVATEARFQERSARTLEQV